jgi:hypothetical protein
MMHFQQKLDVARMFKNFRMLGKQKIKKQRISRRTNHTKERKKR